MRHLLYTTIVLACALNLQSQDINLTGTYKDSVIEIASRELINRYVFPDRGKKMAIALKTANSEGRFSQFTDLNDFLDAVNKIIFLVGNDKHITISLIPTNSYDEEENAENTWIASRMEERKFYRRYNANFKSVEKLENNIGYLDLRGFYGLDYGREFADHAMAQLATSDAIIIDLRNNSGGRGNMVEYLLSYFFEDQIITGLSRKRTGDTYSDRTHKSSIRLHGKTLAETPVFILISDRTFSAAEAFSYPMQVYNRATFIGDTTKGGGNAGDIIEINNELQIFIPDLAALPHPESNATFEGIGIIPDVIVDGDVALDTALALAKKAAVDYESKMDARAKKSLLDLNDIVENYNGNDAQIIIDAYLNCRDNNIIFEEWELNNLGYHFINENNVATALAIFKTNTVLYPHSANVFDSYAEALEMNGDIDTAIFNYKKAIEVAALYKDDRLDMYKANLSKIRP